MAALTGWRDSFGQRLTWSQVVALVNANVHTARLESARSDGVIR